MSERQPTPDPAEPAAADDASAPAAEGSVFANLPRSRPGVRSPRRDGSRRAEPDRPAAASASPGPPPRAAARQAPPPPPPPQAERPDADSEREGGVEELAWAGITVAAEAATLGVRLVGRAFDAVREAAGRR